MGVVVVVVGREGGDEALPEGRASPNLVQPASLPPPPLASPPACPSACLPAANRLEGGIPACLLASPALAELYLGGNRMGGALPAPPPASRLLILSAHSMALAGRLPDFSGAAHLEALLLQGNQLTGALPALPHAMRNLNLQYNRLRWGAGGGGGSVCGDKIAVAWTPPLKCCGCMLLKCVAVPPTPPPTHILHPVQRQHPAAVGGGGPDCPRSAAPRPQPAHRLHPCGCAAAAGTAALLPERHHN